MKKRFLTGIMITVIFVGILLLALCVHAIFFDAFVVLLMLLAAFEMTRALSTRQAKPFLLVVLAGIAVAYTAFFFCYKFTDDATFAMLAFTGGIALAALAALALKLAKKDGSFETVCVLVYPVMVLMFMLLINYIPADTTRANALVLLFLVAPFTDVFAYLVGSTLKGPKLCPAISPKKTISGAVGGLLGGMLGGFIVFLMSQSSLFSFLGMGKMNTGVDVVHFLVMGLFGSAFTQAGDLMASYVKRKVGIKDYGKLLPGHGGVMDRIDGMMFAAMLIYLYSLIFL